MAKIKIEDQTIRLKTSRKGRIRVCLSIFGAIAAIVGCILLIMLAIYGEAWLVGLGVKNAFVR